MKYLLFMFVLNVCIGFYIYEKQPALWDKMMKLSANLEQPGGLASMLNPPPPPPPVQAPSELPIQQAPEAEAVAPLPQVLRPAPAAPEMITPATSTFVSTSHIKVVEDTSPPEYAGKVFTPPATIPAQPDWTWATTDGKHVYHNVVICKIEADCVTILDDEGGHYVNPAHLPPDIQQQLNYDPGLAAAATAARQAKIKKPSTQ